MRQILTDIVMSDERILPDRERTVRMNELGASSINFVIRAWSKSSDLQEVYWDVLERAKKALDAEGISIPYPQMDVNVKQPFQSTPVPVKAEKPQPEQPAIITDTTAQDIKTPSLDKSSDA